MQLFDRFPAKYMVPNTVTCVGLVMGLASIHTSLTATSIEDFYKAAWFILYAVLFDKLDGTAARRLNASSEFGVQLDSFSDFVTFGMAPAALVTHGVGWAIPEWREGPRHDLLLVLGCVYVIAAALRLAKFNVTTSTIGPHFFLGLPSTSSGGIIGAGFLATQELGLGTPSWQVFVGVMAVNAVLMVSNLPQPKLHLSKNTLYRAAQIFGVVSVYVLVPLHRFPTYIVSLALLYTVGGFIYGLSVSDSVLMERGEDDEPPSVASARTP